MSDTLVIPKPPGRPRTKFTRSVSFVLRDGTWVPRGRGRPKPGEEVQVREVPIEGVGANLVVA
jgi:hypothetical protein